MENGEWLKIQPRMENRANSPLFVIRNLQSAICNLQFAILLLFGLFLLVSARPVMAAGELPDDGTVIWNEDYTLAEGDVLEGDLIVFNGDVELEVDSHVQGSVVVWNGDANVEGQIEGELVVSGGNIELGDGAWVQSDVVCTWNCDIKLAEGARVDGEVIEGPSLRGFRFTPGRDFMDAPFSRIPQAPFWTSGPEEVIAWVLRTLRGIVTILVIAIISGLAALIWPDETAQVGSTAFEYPWPSLGIGLLTSAAATALILTLAITICLSPIAFFAALVVSAVGLFGWAAVGAAVGKRLLQALNVREVESPWGAGLGSLLITLISLGLSAAFCLAPLGWLLTVILGCLGLGAVVLTRFGTIPYVPGQMAQSPSPAPDALPPGDEE